MGKALTLVSSWGPHAAGTELWEMGPGMERPAGAVAVDPKRAAALIRSGLAVEKGARRLAAAGDLAAELPAIDAPAAEDVERRQRRKGAGRG